MRKFKYTDDKSYKFWNIELQGSSYTVHFGRIGTKGQAKTKDFPSPEAARQAYEKIIAEKLSDKVQIMMVPSDGKFFFANDVLKGAMPTATVAEPDDPPARNQSGSH